MSEKFVVGKKYKGIISGAVLECVFVGNVYTILRKDDKTEVVLYGSPISNNYVEYVESRKGEFWVNLYIDGKGGSAFLTRKEADNIARERLACVRVPWTEGEGL